MQVKELIGILEGFPADKEVIVEANTGDVLHHFNFWVHEILGVPGKVLISLDCERASSGDVPIAPKAR